MSVDPRPRTWRTSFDQAADDYDAVRPGYPQKLIDDIVTLAALPTPARILEIGSGNGKATLPFAQRGDHLTCLDIGSALLAIARNKFAAYPRVEFHQAAFEDWALPSTGFDLVMSATAFHWIDPEVGYPKAAAALRDGGWLAIFKNQHSGFDPKFASELYRIDQQIVPAWPDPRLVPDLDATIAETTSTIDALGLFNPAIVKTYPWTTTYPTADYLRLLNTYSNYRNLSGPVRDELLRAIGDLIDRKCAGIVTKSYLSILYLARNLHS